MKKLVLACLWLVACTSAVRVEAERALAVATPLRSFTIDDQRAALGVLEGLGCADRDVCLVRDACLKVARPTLRGLELRREGIEQKDAAADASMDAAETHKERARQLFDHAHEQLEQAKAAVPDCDAALAVLERSAKGK